MMTGVAIFFSRESLVKFRFGKKILPPQSSLGMGQVKAIRGVVKTLIYYNIESQRNQSCFLNLLHLIICFFIKSDVLKPSSNFNSRNLFPRIETTRTFRGKRFRELKLEEGFKTSDFMKKQMIKCSKLRKQD